MSGSGKKIVIEAKSDSLLEELLAITEANMTSIPVVDTQISGPGNNIVLDAMPDSLLEELLGVGNTPNQELNQVQLHHGESQVQDQETIPREQSPPSKRSQVDEQSTQQNVHLPSTSTYHRSCRETMTKELLDMTNEELLDITHGNTPSILAVDNTQNQELNHGPMPDSFLKELLAITEVNTPSIVAVDNTQNQALNHGAIPDSFLEELLSITEENTTSIMAVGNTQNQEHNHGAMPDSPFEELLAITDVNTMSIAAVVDNTRNQELNQEQQLHHGESQVEDQETISCDQSRPSKQARSDKQSKRREKTITKEIFENFMESASQGWIGDNKAEYMLGLWWFKDQPLNWKGRARLLVKSPLKPEGDDLFLFCERVYEESLCEDDGYTWTLSSSKLPDNGLIRREYQVLNETGRLANMKKIIWKKGPCALKKIIQYRVDDDFPDNETGGAAPIKED